MSVQHNGRENRRNTGGVVDDEMGMREKVVLKQIRVRNFVFRVCTLAISETCLHFRF
jgi:hypothetical protein